jgi:hypothetical protein
MTMVLQIPESIVLAAGAWVSVFFTLAVYSFLYKENPIFRFAEHTFVATGVGYYIAFNVWYCYDLAIGVPGGEAGFYGGQWWWIFAFLLGAIYYLVLTRKYFWVYRYTLAVIIGVGTGLTLRTLVQAQLLTNIISTFVNLTPLDTAGNLVVFNPADPSGASLINNLLVLVLVFGAVIYFFFTSESGIIKNLGRIGRVCLMTAFGAAYGNTIMTRMNLFIGRAQELLGIRGPSPGDQQIAFVVIGITMLIALVGYSFLTKKPVEEEKAQPSKET